MATLLLNALFTGLAVFIALELHRKIEAKRAKGEPILPFSNPLEEKAEFLPPMTDEEYTAYELAESERGGLLRTIKAKMPWTSTSQKSQSSASSKNTE